MSTITTRSSKGSALTHAELDANFNKGSQAKVGTYTVLASDNRDTIECNGTFTISLPDVATVLAASDTGDFEVTIKNTGTGVITIGRATGADTIDGTASDVTITNNQSVVLKADQAGNGYNILADKNVVEFGTYTFSSVGASATPIEVSIAHSLNTDDIDFQATVRGGAFSVANGSQLVQALFARVDGGMTMAGHYNSGAASPLIITLPTTGNFELRVYNHATVTQDVIVDYKLTPRG